MSEFRADTQSLTGLVNAVFSARLTDLLVLLKPRVMSLVLFTALTGMALAPGAFGGVSAVLSLIAIALGAGAAGAFNMWYDADIDAEMERTKDRPIPAGRVPRDTALALGAGLSLFSIALLWLAANFVAALLLAVTIGFYLFIYTAWLKRRTPQNIVIGGAAGAFPPMIGWAAASGTISLESLALFLIIFFWTPPHFWALALYRADEYARAKVPMLPVVAGPDETRRQIMIYASLLVPVTFLPVLLTFGHMLYGTVAAVGGALFLYFAWRVNRERFGKLPESCANRLFGFSILYLFALFFALLIENSGAGWPVIGQG